MPPSRTEAPVPVHELNATLPPELEPIINKALEKNRELRYQSAAAMRADLEAVRRSREPLAPVPSGLEPRRAPQMEDVATGGGNCSSCSA